MRKRKKEKKKRKKKENEQAMISLQKMADVRLNKDRVSAKNETSIKNI